MNLLLHIGCEKTGTTSLQFWLDRNAAALAGHGIVYSASLGRPNNRRISLYGIPAGTPDNGLAEEGVHTAAQHRALQDRIADSLAAEVHAARAAGCTTFIISNEHLHSRTETPDSVQRVHDLLAPLFDGISVLCSVRPQLDLCLSLASTQAREGLTVSRAWVEAQLAERRYYDMNGLLSLWEAVFGHDAMLPIAFRRTPDLVAWLETRLRLSGAGLPRGTPINEALDYRAMMLTNALATVLPDAERSASGRRFRINDLPMQHRLTMDRASGQALQARFADANAALCAHWPHLQPDDLTPDWSRYPDDGNIDRLNDAAEIGFMLNAVIERMAAELAFTKARLAAAQLERDVHHERFDAALANCRDGIAQAKLAATHPIFQTRMDLLTAQLTERVPRLERRLAAKQGQGALPPGPPPGT